MIVKLWDTSENCSSTSILGVMPSLIWFIIFMPEWSWVLIYVQSWLLTYLSHVIIILLCRDSWAHVMGYGCQRLTVGEGLYLLQEIIILVTWVMSNLLEKVCLPIEETKRWAEQFGDRKDHFTKVPSIKNMRARSHKWQRHEVSILLSTQAKWYCIGAGLLATWMIGQKRADTIRKWNIPDLD